MKKIFIKDRAVFLSVLCILAFLICAIFAPWIAPHSFSEVFHDSVNTGVSYKFFLGTDDLGRDTFSRLVYGARVSLISAMVAVMGAFFIGLFLGMSSVIIGGKFDEIVMSCVDMLMSLPGIFLAIVVGAILGPGLETGLVAIGVIALPGFIRVVRSAFLEQKGLLYVMNLKAQGAGVFRTFVFNILPNALPAILVQMTFGFSEGILNIAALGFLGLGAQPPIPEWGTMLSESRDYIEQSPWLLIYPGMCIFLVVLSLNIMGDALRDFFDPRLN